MQAYAEKFIKFVRFVRKITKFAPKFGKYVCKCAEIFVSLC